jgi:hypothetical protein
MSEQRTFAAACPRCGDTDLADDQLWLVLTGRPERDHYAFRCPGCDDLVRRPANAVTVRVLQRLVAVEEVAIPAEALEPRADQPLTVDHLIDLMLSLEDVGA